MVETFHKTLKSEVVWRMVFNPSAEATQTIDSYIDQFYNPARRRLALDFRSSVNTK